MDTWTALPPRRKKRGAETAIAALEASCNSSASSDPTVSAAGSLSSSTTSAQLYEKVIEDNVQARSVFNRATATLEGKDGCAGEFYEYLDHTADVQCHAWGSSLKEAFEHMAPCMFNYITDLSTVDVVPDKSIEFVVKGHDTQSLLFNYMDEFLFRFCTDGFCCVRCEIKEFNKDTSEIRVEAHGDTYDQSKHPQGTEIKAITYSNMQIHETPERADLYVIVDI